MPYAQWHYPFENADTFERSFPADFIAEGIDQTRGWFYTLHAIATLVFDQPAFRNVIANGLVLDKDGRKMSKRLNNAIDPFETIGQYGADVVRWYMIENCPPWENLRFNLEHLAETQRKFFGTLYNTYSFFALYANIDEYRVGETGPVELTELDHWLYSRLESTHAQVQAAFEAYEPTQAARLIQQFVIDDLSNWYIRLCRRRYWKGSMTPNKRAAYDVLATVLSRVAQWMSPIAPFFADWLYRNLHVHTLPPEGSVHLTHWAAGKPEAIDPELEHRMAIAQEVCSLVRGIRRKHNLKVRYPLQKVLIPVLAESDFEPIRRVEDLIRSEVNVKAVVPVLDAGEAIVKSIKPNFKILGPKAGPFLKEIGTHLQGWSQSQISAFQVAQTADLTLANGQHLTLTAEDVEIAVKDLPGWAVASANGITVALDLTLTEELRQEGIARELVNRIQNLRKDLDFDVTDRIRIWLQPHEHWTEALVSFRDYIAAEVLALHFDVSPVQRPEAPHELDLDGELGYIRIERVS
jgi:isoleucyl-tRNA synthetase